MIKWFVLSCPLVVSKDRARYITYLQVLEYLCFVKSPSYKHLTITKIFALWNHCCDLLRVTQIQKQGLVINNFQLVLRRQIDRTRCARSCYMWVPIKQGEIKDGEECRCLPRNLCLQRLAELNRNTHTHKHSMPIRVDTVYLLLLTFALAYF